MKLHLLYLSIVISGLPLISKAEIYLKPAIMYTTEKSKTGTTTTIETQQRIEFSLLYGTDGGWAIGGAYNTEKITDETSPGASVDSNRTNIGPVFGWISKNDFGPFILLNYFIQCTKTISTLTYKGTTCYQADLGLKVNYKKSFFGVQLSQRSFKYPTYEYAGTTTTVNNEETLLHPYFVAFLTF